MSPGGEPGPVGLRWGLSVLDWLTHAIDERRDHPLGVLTARCGHRLMMVTPLREAPFGTPCRACALGERPAGDAPGPGREGLTEAPGALTGAELVDWMALSRVRGGAVTEFRGGYLDGGRLVPGYLVPGLLFDALLRVGLLRLESPDAVGVARLSMTDTGRARFEDLRSRREAPRDPAPSG
ncbi:MAG: hypothetical protein ACRDRS_26470, partial [Pseudonocardiaceae bacterium]